MSCLHPKDNEKGNLTRENTLDNNCSAAVSTTRKLWLHPTPTVPAKAEGSLDFHPWNAVNKYLNTTARMISEKVK